MCTQQHDWFQGTCQGAGGLSSSWPTSWPSRQVKLCSIATAWRWAGRGTSLSNGSFTGSSPAMMQRESHRPIQQREELLDVT